MKQFLRLCAGFLMLVVLAACAAQGPRTDGLVKASAYDKAVQSSTYHEAVKRYSALYEQNKNNMVTLLALSRNLRYAGQPERALERLTAAERNFGDHPAFLTEMGKVYLAKGEFRRAESKLREATRKSEDNWDGYSSLGIAYDFLGDYQSAAIAYNRAIETCPDSASILNNTAISAALTGDMATAQALLLRASQLRPHSEMIKNNLKLIRLLSVNCPACGPEDVKREFGLMVTSQNWANGDLACTVGPQEIVDTLSHAEFIDLKIEFEFDKAELLPEARATLDGLGYALSSEELRSLRFRLEGHTDATGSAAYNQALSERRAQTVEAYLVEILGLDASRLEAIGFGETRLLISEDPTNAANRRVRVLRLP